MTFRNRVDSLAIGASMRISMLSLYQHGPAEDAQRIARRSLFEIGEVLSDMHGRSDAASIVYNVADAITCHIPVEDFQLPAAKTESVEQPALGYRIVSVLNRAVWPFFIGLWVGVVVEHFL